MSIRTTALRHCFLVLVGASVAWLCTPLPAQAQAQQGHQAPGEGVRGQVTDAQNGQPLPGASVLIKGTSRGTATDRDGRYALDRVPAESDSLVFTFIGYERQAVAIAGRARIDVALESTSQALDEVVITALNVERDKRALGYSIEKVDGTALAETKESHVVNALAGKVAGVNVTGGSSGIASTPRITIRGQSSLSGNDTPLFVVDGMPLDNSTNTTRAGAQSTQADFGDALSQISPDDVEQISILKGPSAAALYGSRAAGGAVLITTKSGRGTEGLGVSLSSSAMAETVLKLPDYQNEYGAGAGGQYKFVNGDGTGGGIDGQAYNWGPPLDGREITQIGSPRDEDGNLVPIPFESRGTPVREFFDTGISIKNNVAVHGGNDQGHFRASYTRSDRTGVVPNTELAQNNVSLAAGYDLSEKLRVTTNATYVTTQSDNVPTSGYGSESIMYSFLWFGRHLDLRWLEDYWMEGAEGRQQRNFDMNWTNNVYFQVHENTNSLDKNRLYGNLTASYDFTDRLTLRARTLVDYNSERTEMRKAFSSVTAVNGSYGAYGDYFREWNADALLTYTVPVNEDWSSEVSVGANHMSRYQEWQTMEAEELSVPGVYNIGNTRSNVSSTEYEQQKVVNSAYGTAQVGFQEMIFLNVTARNDWSSTLPVDNNSYFYPSVSLSAVLTDLFDISTGDGLSFAKVRASWAQAGNDTDPHRLSNTYNYGNPWGSTQTVTVPAEIANSDLKPEIKTSYELGANVQFFQRRLGVDVTHYRSSTENQILRVPLANSTGYTGRFINAGQIDTHGWEVSLNATPLQDLGGVSWDARLNWTRNRSKVVELSDGINSYVIANPYGGTVEARVGGRMGAMYGRVFERVDDPSSPYAGEIIYEGGLPQLTDKVQRVGNYNHDWTAGLSNMLSFRSFRLNFLFDIRQGGRIYSYTHATGIEGGTLEETTESRGEDVTGDGVVRNADGSFSPNEERTPYVNWLRAYYARDNIESNSFEASYVKLREARLGFVVPSRWTLSWGMQKAEIALIGRNLLLFSDVPHIDPETTTTAGGQRIPGFEVVQLPSRRSFGLSVDVRL